MHIKPFKGYRPIPAVASKVALIPNNLMNEPDRRRALKNNPYSFAHVVKPRINFPDNVRKTDRQLFDFANSYFEKLVSEGIIIRDNTPCYYIYQMHMDERTQTGLICCVDISNYDKGYIKKHEHTRTEKEIENALHIEMTHLNSNPVFLAYKPVVEIDSLIESITSTVNPDYDFLSDFGAIEKLWVVKENATLELITKLFYDKVFSAYIADGHHRAAAASLYSKKVNDLQLNSHQSKDYNFLLTCLLPADQLKIYDYNRVVKSLNGLDEKYFLKKISENFEVIEARRSPYNPTKPHRFGMYLGSKWYRLKAKESIIGKDVIGALDVTILQNYLLEPILGIHDPKTDKNIDFIAGIMGLRDLEKRVSKGKAAVAFSLFPVSMDELMAVSDAGEVMPPKSTWFEPKLLSGLVVFRMEF